MKKLLACFVLLVTAATEAGAQSFPGWVNYRSPEGRYFVMLPGQPRVFAQEATAGSGEKFPQYIASASDNESGAAYFASYFDMTPTQTYSLADGRDGMAKAVNGVVVRETPAILDGYPGLDVTIESGEFVFRARFYQIERRIYIVEAATPKGATPASADKIAKFLESFRVTKTPY